MLMTISDDEKASELDSTAGVCRIVIACRLIKCACTRRVSAMATPCKTIQDPFKIYDSDGKGWDLDGKLL
jgi:hypothetical protein